MKMGISIFFWKFRRPGNTGLAFSQSNNALKLGLSLLDGARFLSLKPPSELCPPTPIHKLKPLTPKVTVLGDRSSKGLSRLNEILSVGS